ncbi:MAG: ABC transporter substrate-binding protein [Dehalococcoidia bacterium]
MDSTRPGTSPASPPVRRLSRRAALRGAALSAAGVVLAGCTRERSLAPADSPTPTQTAAPSATPGTLASKRGGTLHIAGQLTGDVIGLDYDRLGSPSLGSIANLAGVRLTQWDERPDSTGPVEAVLPDLAESWETPDQGLTWTFKLRRGVKTPEGLELSAADVIWSLNRQVSALRQPLGLLEANLPDLYTGRQVNAKALDDHTLQFKLAKPDADFLSMMGSHWWTVEHRDVITRKGAEPGKIAPGWGEVTAIDQIRGGGPYYPVEYVPASGFKLKRNPNYYNAELAHLDGIEHRFIADPADAAAALLADQLDAFGSLVPFSVAQGVELQRSDRLQVDWQPSLAWSPWIFDMRRTPFNDVRVRRAFALAIDRASWIKNLLLGRGRNAALVLPWLTSWVLDPAKMGEDGKYLNTYDPAEAKKLLLAAGQEKFKFQLQTSNNAEYTVTFRYADLMTSMLAAVGITQETRIVDYAAHTGGKVFPDGGVYQSFVSRPDIQSYTFAQAGLGGATVGGADVWGALARSDAEYAAFREIAQKQRLVTDRSARRELVNDMQRRMAKHMWTFNWPAPDFPVVSSRRVRDFRPTPGWTWSAMKYAWKEPPTPGA